MSEHNVTISWENTEDSLNYDQYDRNHKWKFENGTEIIASAAPEFYGDQSCIDPEEAFVASISSCHMLTFIAICSKKGFVVNSYKDNAIGILEKNDSGRMSVTKVILNPEIEFSRNQDPPSTEQIQRLHDSSHRNCFIANSVKTEISVAMV